MAKLTALQEFDRAVLKVLRERRDEMTYVIRNRLSASRWISGLPQSIKTSAVLRACRRLQSLGYVEETPSNYMVQKCWKITPAGLAALEDEGR